MEMIGSGYFSQSLFCSCYPAVGAAFPKEVDGLCKLFLGLGNVTILLEPVGIRGMIRRQMPPQSVSRVCFDGLLKPELCIRNVIIVHI